MKELMTVNSGNATIIDRREIKPLLVKACRLMSFYEKAMGCPALVLDKAGSSIQSIEQRQTPFCEACSNSFSKDHVKWTLAEHPCIHMHKEALTYPSRGDVYIYTCKAGFSYWTSPIYSGGRYAGSISAGQVMAAADINVIERINSIEGMPAEKLMDMLSAVPLKKPEEIQAMAKLLSLCARKISVSPCDQGSVLRRRPARTTGRIRNIFSDNPGKLNFQDKERSLLAALRRGDRNTVAQILKEIMGIIEKTGQDEFDYIRLQSVELAVLISREAGKNFRPDEAYNRCFRRLKESQNVQELCDNLQNAIDQLGVKIFSYQGICHALALRRAERFIWENYSRKITLEEIAGVSGLSAPYFSTIFKKELGLNLCDYLNKLRIEKAAAMLAGTNIPLAEIASTCGYEDQSWFSKVFKNRMGVSPGKYRERGR